MSDYEIKFKNNNSGLIKVTTYIYKEDISISDDVETEIDNGIKELEDALPGVDIVNYETNDRIGAVIEYKFKDLEDLDLFFSEFDSEIVFSYEEKDDVKITIDTTYCSSYTDSEFEIIVPKLKDTNATNTDGNKIFWDDEDQSSNVLTFTYSANYTILIVVAIIVIGSSASIGVYFWKRKKSLSK